MPAPRRRILLINPNSTAATTAAMAAIARDAAGEGWTVTGLTASRAPPLITGPAALAAAAAEVVEMALANQHAHDGTIVAAFGDPGLAMLRRHAAHPVTGIGEAAMREAAGSGRRFGVATTTPGLAAAIHARASELGLGGQYTGLRLTPGDPAALMADPDALRAALADAVNNCIRLDGADAVVIGGGPLGPAALALQPFFPVPVIVPVQAATRTLCALINRRGSPMGR